MLALFVSLGGTALAIQKNSVKSKHIVNGQVRSVDVADDGTASALRTEDLATDAVTNDDLADDAVDSGEIQTNAVTSSKIANSTIVGEDIAVDTIQSFDIGIDAVGQQEIANSAVGDNELSSISAVSDATPFDFGDQDEGNNDYVYGTSTADCPASTQVIGGGAVWVGGGNGGAGGDELQAITESMRLGNGWTVIGVSDVDNQDLEAIAYCLESGI